jgi:hypothetical protein
MPPPIGSVLLFRVHRGRDLLIPPKKSQSFWLAKFTDGMARAVDGLFVAVALLPSITC